MKFLTLALLGLLLLAGNTANAAFMMAGSDPSVPGGAFHYLVTQNDSAVISATGATASDYVYMYQLETTTILGGFNFVSFTAPFQTLAGNSIATGVLTSATTVASTVIPAGNGLSFVGPGLSQILYLISSNAPAASFAPALAFSANGATSTSAPVPVPLPPAAMLAVLGLPFVRLLKRKQV
jgi:hypothetical protein